MSSIFDLVMFPTRETYTPKNVMLIFVGKDGEKEMPLLKDNEPQFHETELTPWINAGRLFYRELHEGESGVH